VRGPVVFLIEHHYREKTHSLPVGFLPQAVDAGSVGRDGRGWVDGASGSGGGGVGVVDIGLFRWV